MSCRDICETSFRVTNLCCDPFVIDHGGITGPTGPTGSGIQPVVTSFPVTGTGEITDPVTLEHAPLSGNQLFWQENPNVVSPPQWVFSTNFPYQATVGPTTGHFQSISDGIAAGLSHLLVIENTTEGTLDYTILTTSNYTIGLQDSDLTINGHIFVPASNDVAFRLVGHSRTNRVIFDTGDGDTLFRLPTTLFDRPQLYVENITIENESVPTDLSETTTGKPYLARSLFRQYINSVDFFGSSHIFILTAGSFVYNSTFNINDNSIYGFVIFLQFGQASSRINLGNNIFTTAGSTVIPSIAVPTIYVDVRSANVSGLFVEIESDIPSTVVCNFQQCLMQNLRLLPPAGSNTIFNFFDRSQIVNVIQTEGESNYTNCTVQGQQLTNVTFTAQSCTVEGILFRSTSSVTLNNTSANALQGFQSAFSSVDSDISNFEASQLVMTIQSSIISLFRAGNSTLNFPVAIASEISNFLINFTPITTSATLRLINGQLQNDLAGLVANNTIVSLINVQTTTFPIIMNSTNIVVANSAFTSNFLLNDTSTIRASSSSFNFIGFEFNNGLCRINSCIFINEPITIPLDNENRHEIVNCNIRNVIFPPFSTNTIIPLFTNCIFNLFNPLTLTGERMEINAQKARFTNCQFFRGDLTTGLIIVNDPSNRVYFLNCQFAPTGRGMPIIVEGENHVFNNCSFENETELTLTTGKKVLISGCIFENNAELIFTDNDNHNCIVSSCLFQSEPTSDVSIDTTTTNNDQRPMFVGIRGANFVGGVPPSLVVANLPNIP